MEELFVTGRDRARLSHRYLLSLVVLYSLFTIRLVLIGWVWPAAVLLPTAAASIVLGILARRRSWYRVDAQGIGWSRGGVGQPRFLGWGDVTWVAVKEQSAQRRHTAFVRITGQDGKRRTLPLLMVSPAYPDPEFHQKAEQVIERWRFFTEASTRAEPPVRRSDRMTDTLLTFSNRPMHRQLFGYVGPVFLTLTALLLCAAVGTALSSDLVAARTYRTAETCVGDAYTGCLIRQSATVTGVSVGDGRFRPTHITLSVANPPLDPYPEEADFHESAAWFDSLRPGDTVHLDSFLGQPILSIGDSLVSFETTEAPGDQVRIDEVGLLFFAGWALLTGTWAVSRRLARRRGTRVPFRWWVPASLPALLALLLLLVHLTRVPAPVPVTWFAAIAAVLAVGLLAAHRRTLLSRGRRGPLGSHDGSSTPTPGW